MMETSVIQGCLIALAAFSAWFLGVSFEKIKTNRQIRSSARRFELLEKEAESYRKDLGKTREEILALQRTLAGERSAQAESLLTMTQGFHKKMVRIAAAFAGGGMLLGGLLCGWGVQAHADLEAMRHFMELEVQVRVAQARVEGLELQLSNAKQDYKQLWKNFMDNLEIKTLTTAKLESLLDQLSARKLKGGLELDVEALRKNLEELQRHDPAQLAEWMPVSVAKI